MPIPINRCDRMNYNDLFALLPARVRQTVVEKAETRLYKAGDVIFRKNDEGACVYAILTGRVKIARTIEESGEMIITFVERGQIFGERSFYDGLPRSASAIAVEDTAVQIFPRDVLLPMLYAYPDTLMYNIRTMCNRIFRYINQLELYALCNLEVRLANLLLLLGEKYGEKIEGGITLHAKITQSDLAHQVASSRESVNRQLKHFAAEGYIEMHGNEIILKNIDGLKQACATAEERSRLPQQPADVPE